MQITTSISPTTIDIMASEMAQCEMEFREATKTLNSVVAKNAGGTAEGASTRDFAVLLKNLLGVKFKVVTGYAGSRQINLALERGEIQGGCGQSWSSVSATQCENGMKQSVRRTRHKSIDRRIRCHHAGLPR